MIDLSRSHFSFICYNILYDKIVQIEYLIKYKLDPKLKILIWYEHIRWYKLQNVHDETMSPLAIEYDNDYHYFHNKERR